MSGAQKLTKKLIYYRSAVPPGQISLPAPRFGAYECDSPRLLINAVMHAIGSLTGTTTGQPFPILWNGIYSLLFFFSGPEEDNTFTIFTGDLTSHDNDNQLDRSYLRYVEVSIFEMFKEYLSGPVYAAMVNSSPSFNVLFASSLSQFYREITTSILKRLIFLTAWDLNRFQTNLSGTMAIWLSEYQDLRYSEWVNWKTSSLWQIEGWIDEKTADIAKQTYCLIWWITWITLIGFLTCIRYSAYSVVTRFGLKVIT